MSNFWGAVHYWRFFVFYPNKLFIAGKPNPAERKNTMLKFIATDVVTSKGYCDNPALRFSEDNSSIYFRIGKRVYDKRAKDDHRYVNINVKAFGDLCERIKKMKLTEGSYVHLEGRYDEDVWDDNGQKKCAPAVILTNIEYSYSDNGGKSNGNTSAEEPPSSSQDTSGNQAAQQNDSVTAEQQKMPNNFTGFESFGGPNPFFPG